MLFDECNAIDVLLDDTPLGNEMVVFRKDGIPLMPEALYLLVIERHMPLRVQELKAIVKIILAGTFLWYVAIVVDAFKVSDRASLGNNIGTLLAASLPSLVEVFSTDDLQDERLKFKIRQTVEDYFGEDLKITLKAIAEKNK